MRHAPRLVGWWGMSLAIVLLACAFDTAPPMAAAQSGDFPSFISMPGVSARGVAVDKTGNVYVSVEEIRSSVRYIQVRKFSPVGDLVFTVEVGQGTIGGLTVKADGDVYIALAAGASRGVYRMDVDGGLELLPGTGQIFFANGLAFDDVGTLWITESVSMGPTGPAQGGIWRIPAQRGWPELCLRDALLTGTGALRQPVPIGANGIAYYHGNLFVTNTEKGTVLRMPVSPDGTVGVLEVWTTLAEVPESPLGKVLPFPPMGDGIALDVHGNLYVAVLTRSAIVRLDLFDKSQQTMATYSAIPVPLSARLDFPASPFFGTGMGERTNLFVTNMGTGGWFGSSLVKIGMGVPGRPVH
jgi:sugar lactone lactonase YvrE